jgi:hypothetical protein
MLKLKNMKIRIFAFVLFVSAFAGCDLLEEDITAPDGSLPYITVSSPSENAVYSKGQTFNLKSEISDKDKINQLDVRVTKINTDSGSQPVWGFTKQPMRNPVIIDTAFTVSSLPAGDYILTLNTVDGRTNVGTKEIKFSIK